MILFVFAIIGFNEIMMLILLLILAFIIFVDYNNIRKKKFLLLYLFICAALFAVIVIVAPGNYARIENTNRVVREVTDTFSILLLSSKESFMLAFHNFIIWSKSFYLFLVSFIFLDIFSKAKDTLKKEMIFNINPLYALLLFLLVPASYYPSFYAINFCEYRLIDFSYFIFLIVWFYNLCVFCNFFSRKMKPFKIPLAKISYISLSIIILLLIIEPNNVRVVYGDLIKGRATEYKRQIDKRQLEILNCPYKECMVDSFDKKNFPSSIFTGDITPSPHHWVNLCYSKYFYKDSIYTPFPKKY